MWHTYRCIITGVKNRSLSYSINQLTYDKFFKAQMWSDNNSVQPHQNRMVMTIILADSVSANFLLNFSQTCMLCNRFQAKHVVMERLSKTLCLFVSILFSPDDGTSLNSPSNKIHSQFPTVSSFCMHENV